METLGAQIKDMIEEKLEHLHSVKIDLRFHHHESIQGVDWIKQGSFRRRQNIVELVHFI